MGISTLCAMYSLHNMLFNSDFKILVVATKQDVAKNLVQKVQVGFENLPTFLKQGISINSNNKLTLSFSNGSEIKAISSSPDAARSEALSLLILDEFAFVEYADQIWASAQMTLATGGSTVILSTPNGIGNKFHKIWTEATSGIKLDNLGSFHAITLPWYLHPERDQAWRDEQDVLLGKRIAAQECDCDFLTSGHTVIDHDIMKYYSDMCVDPIETRGIGGDIWIWKYPESSKSYVVAADPSRGDGEDYSTFIIMEVESVEIVGEFKGKIDTQSFGRMLISISTEYNDALLVIDNKNVGWSTIQVVVDSGYKNLFYSYKNDPYLDENIHIRKNYDLKNKEDMVPGLTTTTLTRPVYISKLETYFREKTPKLYSKRFMSELQVFMWINGKPQAQTGYHDDLVMAMCYGLYIRDTALRLRQLGIDLTKNSLKKTYKTVYKPKPVGESYWQMNTGHAGDKESLRWLL